MHHPTAVYTVAKQRMLDRHAAADHHRTVRAIRAARREVGGTGRANVARLWTRRSEGELRRAA